MLFLCASLAVLASSVSASCKYVFDYSKANQALAVETCNYASISGSVESFRYTCTTNATINRLTYNGSRDCSGDPLSTEVYTSVNLTFDCAASEYCGKSIQEKYPCGCHSSGCLVDIDYTFVDDICSFNSSEGLGAKVNIDCDENKATIYTYNSSDCSGSPIDEEVTESGCVTSGSEKNATKFDFGVCGNFVTTSSPGGDTCQYVLDNDVGLPLAFNTCNFLNLGGYGFSFKYKCLDSDRVQKRQYTSNDCSGQYNSTIFTHENASFDCSAEKTCGELLEQKTPCGCEGDGCDAHVGFYIVEDTCVYYPSNGTSAEFGIDCSGGKATKYSYSSSDCSGTSISDTITSGCIKDNSTNYELMICSVGPTPTPSPSGCKYILDYDVGIPLAFDTCNSLYASGYEYSFKYKCLDSTRVEKYQYTSAGCSGQYSSTIFTHSSASFDCWAEKTCKELLEQKQPCNCEGADCNVAVKFYIVENTCVYYPDSDTSAKFDLDCSGGRGIRYSYSSSDCSGTSSSDIIKSGCIKEGTGANATEYETVICDAEPTPSPGSNSCKYVLDYNVGLPLALDTCNSLYAGDNKFSFKYTCLDSDRVKMYQYTSADCTGSSEFYIYTHANTSFDCSAKKTCKELLEQKQPCNCEGTDCNFDLKFYIVENTCIYYPESGTTAKFDLDCDGGKGTMYSYTSSDCSGTGSPDTLMGGCKKGGTGENATEYEIVICDATDATNTPSPAPSFSYSVIGLLALFFSLQIFS